MRLCAISLTPSGELTLCSLHTEETKVPDKLHGQMSHWNESSKMIQKSVKEDKTINFSQDETTRKIPNNKPEVEK
jgi:hypothetical protein